MSLNNIMIATQTGLQEIALKTLETIVSVFKEKFDMEAEDMTHFTDEVRAKLLDEYKVDAKTGKGKKEKAERKKREPSAHNVWIKEKMAALKEEDPSLKGPALMKKANELYRESDLYKQNQEKKAAFGKTTTPPTAEQEATPVVTETKPKTKKGGKKTTAEE